MIERPSMDEQGSDVTVMPRTAKLKKALDRFQSDLDRKLVDGDQDEVRSWLAAIRSSFDALKSIVDAQRERAHERALSHVSTHDDKQRGDVRELKESKEHVSELFEIVNAQILALEVECTTDVEPRVQEEPFCQTTCLELVDRGTELVNWIREQESAMTAWIIETFAD